MPEAHRESAVPQEEREKTKVSKLYFLIHPGYSLICDIREGEIESTVGLSLVNKKELEKYQNLLDAYVAKAEEIKNNKTELVFLFLSEDREFIRDVKDKVKDKSDAGFKILDDMLFTAIHKMKQILGRRFIVLTEDSSIKKEEKMKTKKTIKSIAEDNEHLKEITGAMRGIAAGRGYWWDETVASEAFGEYWDACVQDGSQNLKKALKLSNEPYIREGLTDVLWEQK